MCAYLSVSLLILALPLTASHTLNEKTFNQRSNERWIFRAYRNVFTRNTDCNLSLDNVQKVTVGE
jgi:hypothetical protein